MKVKLLRRCRRRVGYKYRILTRKQKHKIYQIWEWRGSGWGTVSEEAFWKNYRWEMVMEARNILGNKIFNIKTLG
jgi:hypothetical protein